MASSGGNKTEKATPQRLRKAREEGDFVSSRALPGAIQFAVFVALIGSTVSGWGPQMRIAFSTVLTRAMKGEISVEEWPTLLARMSSGMVLPLLQILAIIWVASVGSHLAITRMAFSTTRLAPKLDRLNPMARLRELPAQNGMAVLQAACLLAVMAIVLKSFFDAQAADLLRLPFESVPAASRQVAEAVQSILWKAAGVFVVFGAVDLFQQQRRYQARLRMSKEEIKEENKRNDGDPQIKARIRRLRRDLLRRQMMREVPKATAVIVNPTHFAVAIRYDSDSMVCPVVVAKGKNWLALRIRQLAVENEVPVIENAPLARALYDAIEVGRAISPEFYRAIAEILAYVYRMMGRNLQR
ncbi:MAG: EscU/YscU/HrcU family type III secretion system export apparatus switch protein [Acidobacteriaceae bacterium]|nr:EscU/YscU/HrcU family type III secretion system export apparatus switch protein [Acidobacteriaceae bacterium]